MNETQRLIEQIKSKQSSAAATRLVDLYKGQVFTLCLRIVRNRQVAEELAQDAFLKALKNLGSLKEIEKFRQWLLRLTYNIAIDAVRKKSIKYNPIEVAGQLRATDDPLAELINKDRRKTIEHAFSRFDKEDRAILTLYYLEDQSIKAIEQITGLSRSNIKVKLFRAREKLKVSLRKSQEQL